ncbi:MULTISPECIES: acetolactate synthase large subunit [Niallia]|jgi:acetolactate synthase I/II/III large subunit|uniref:Acetolactate synthase n=1 Tax=Niallia circulans TaxID=1397 RepID=A0A268FA57_NIACI|nr:acetolactate synthase large subunit [Niallia circulans]AYV67381.1 acetolactate synthase, large subunit, biosynthetic type [Niallia circulans]AYV74347.1 acetolactate synthase, large subunit, biosynthetic type [Niallia circulans]NRG25753.1 acetolactate synthase large subunit [Niallia circulans]PAD82258.1 acetolactate synthase, large subunit, biosynthetic type [Niallia circulans]QJX63323.1 acetolactate synthase large subunit [Niallia circulans]
MLQETAFENTKAQVKPLTGADLLLQALEKENVEFIFGYPGGAVLPIYDKIYDSKIFHVLPRHEQGGIHAAEGYARISGKPGVVIATSGPGATNIVTGLADAMMDSLPLVVFTGQVATGVIGTDAFQEADILGITTPITKYNCQVRNLEDIPRIIKEAFYIATSGRPGPVLIDIPKDIAATISDVPAEQDIELPGYQPKTQPNYLQIRKLTEAVSAAKKPVILAGAGVNFAKASAELLEYAEQQQIPVVHTLLGLGGFPADNKLFVGMGGMHGCYAANMALYEADLLINVGARFDDRLTGNLVHFAPNAIKAHIDIDPAEIGKIVPTKIPIVADAKEALTMLIKQKGLQSNHNAWLEKIENWKNEYPYYYKESNLLKPQQVLEMLFEKTKGEAIVTTDVGQHQMWAAQYYHFKESNRWVTSGGLGTMGFGLPSSIGAQLADPKATVLAISGDGGFQMCSQELALIRELNLPIKIIIFNNRALGMVRQWQEIFYESRFSHSKESYQPSFVALAEAYGIKGYQISSVDEAANILDEVLAIREPVLLDFRIDPDENVYPMIAPGKGLHEMVGMKP